MIIDTSRKGISKGVLVTVATVAVACTLLNSSVLTVVIKKRHEKYKQTSSRKSLHKFQIWMCVLKTDYSDFKSQEFDVNSYVTVSVAKLSINIDGVKSFNLSINGTCNLKL